MEEIHLNPLTTWEGEHPMKLYTNYKWRPQQNCMHRSSSQSWGFTTQADSRKSLWIGQQDWLQLTELPSPIRFIRHEVECNHFRHLQNFKISEMWNCYAPQKAPRFGWKFQKNWKHHKGLEVYLPHKAPGRFSSCWPAENLPKWKGLSYNGPTVNAFGVYNGLSWVKACLVILPT